MLVKGYHRNYPNRIKKRDKHRQCFKGTTLGITLAFLQANLITRVSIKCASRENHLSLHEMTKIAAIV